MTVIPYPCRPLPAPASRLDRLNTQALARCEPRADDKPWVPTRTEPRKIRASRGRNLSVGFDTDQEFYRAHTQAHLYDGWHLDLIAEQRQARAVDGHLNADCHWCKRTVLVTPDAERCTHCGHPLD